MSKDKSEKEPTVEAERPVSEDKKKEVPEIDGSPEQKAPANRMEGVHILSRATANWMADSGGGGPSNRAQLSENLQGSLGNQRVGQVLGAQKGNKIQRQPKEPGKDKAAVDAGDERQDVVIILARPSLTIPKNETADEKIQMETWRAAAHALSPVVFEGLTVDQAFVNLKKVKKPIGKLYVIGHADEAGFGEVNSKGEQVSTTVEDLTARMKKATGALGANKPESVEMLSCFGGGTPQTMGKIGETLGAQTVRAPVQMTVISGRTLNLNGKLLSASDVQKLPEKTLIDFIQRTDGMKFYDFAAGVPHPAEPPSDPEKQKALIAQIRRVGMISYISFNSQPGERDAVPYWKAPIMKRKKTEELPETETFTNKGLIQVDIQEEVKKP